MTLAFDTHAHLYPCHDLAVGLRCLARHLERTGCDALAACLTERRDCQVFRRLAAGELDLPVPEFAVEPVPGALLVRRQGGGALYIFPGRQIVTAERIEILALMSDVEVAGGTTAAETVKLVRAAGAVPVLSWAPGKWFFGRKRPVQELIEAAVPGELLIGDTSLRPTVWPCPGLMRRAAARGLTVVAGSDPLPFPGDETYLGVYASRFEAGIDDPADPVASVRGLLTAPGAAVRSVGRRCGPVAVLRRLRRNARASRCG